MSAIARMMLGEGKEVFGSDRASSLVTTELEKLGATIFYGHRAENLEDDIDLVIYTIAISEDNPELKKARGLGIDCLTYPEALGLLSKDKFTIAVAGTHGKTTTTAMIAKIMIDAGLGPTVIVGSLLKEQDSNFIAGQSEFLVVEACEYRRSFLNLLPQIGVITNIDSDHLDYYKDLDDIKSAFAEFASKISADGYLICDTGDEALASVIKSTEAKILNYSDFPRVSDQKAPGEHNIKNAQAALAVASILKLDEKNAQSSLRNFVGTWRRFDYKGETFAGAKIFDDYAHHPTEVAAAIAGARSYMKNGNLSGRLIVVFQPHLYSRTKILAEDFARALSSADDIIMTPIYAAREKPDPQINSELLVEAINKNGGSARYFENFDLVIGYLSDNSKPDDLIIAMGAGDIYQVAKNLTTAKVKIEV